MINIIPFIDFVLFAEFSTSVSPSLGGTVGSGFSGFSGFSVGGPAVVPGGTVVGFGGGADEPGRPVCVVGLVPSVGVTGGGSVGFSLGTVGVVPEMIERKNHLKQGISGLMLLNCKSLCRKSPLREGDEGSNTLKSYFSMLLSAILKIKSRF